jgi:glycine dehydrogenase
MQMITHLKNAPHTFPRALQQMFGSINTQGNKQHFRLQYLKINKYWSPVARVDNVYGDRNLVCSCPSLDSYREQAA